MYGSCIRPAVIPDICIRVDLLERMLMLLAVPERVEIDINQACKDAGVRNGYEWMRCHGVSVA